MRIEDINDAVPLPIAMADRVYQLATAQALAANTGTDAKAGIHGGSYIWDAQFTGTSIKLQALGSDGTTWRDVATATASGAVGVVVGGNATLRLYNPNGAGLTAVSSSLS